MKKKIDKIALDALQGNTDALIAYAELKELSDYIAVKLDDLKEAAVQEAAKYDEDKFQTNGFQITKVKPRAIWSFKHIEYWATLQQDIKEFEQVSKSAYSAYQRGQTIIDDNGEVIPLPEVKYTQEGLSVKKL